MALQLAKRYRDETEIPPAMRELYKYEGGYWHFDYSQVEGAVDPAEFTAAYGELRAEREAHKATKRRLAAYRAGDAPPPLTDEERAQRDEYERLVEEVERLEFELHKRTEAEVQRLAEEIAAERVAELEAELAAKHDELEGIRQELAELRLGETERVEIDTRLQAIKDALPRFAFVEGVEADLVWHAIEGPEPLQVGRDGRVRSARGESVVQWIERLARSRPHWSRNAPRREAPRSLFR